MKYALPKNIKFRKTAFGRVPNFEYAAVKDTNGAVVLVFKDGRQVIEEYGLGKKTYVHLIERWIDEHGQPLQIKKGGTLETKLGAAVKKPEIPKEARAPDKDYIATINNFKDYVRGLRELDAGIADFARARLSAEELIRFGGALVEYQTARTNKDKSKAGKALETIYDYFKIMKTQQAKPAIVPRAPMPAPVQRPIRPVTIAPVEPSEEKAEAPKYKVKAPKAPTPVPAPKITQLVDGAVLLKLAPDSKIPVKGKEEKGKVRAEYKAPAPGIEPKDGGEDLVQKYREIVDEKLEAAADSIESLEAALEEKDEAHRDELARQKDLLNKTHKEQLGAALDAQKEVYTEQDKARDEIHNTQLAQELEQQKELLKENSVNLLNKTEIKYRKIIGAKQKAIERLKQEKTDAEAVAFQKQDELNDVYERKKEVDKYIKKLEQEIKDAGNALTGIISLQKELAKSTGINPEANKYRTKKGEYNLWKLADDIGERYAAMLEKEKALGESADKIESLEARLVEESKAHKAGLAEQKDVLEKKYLVQLKEDLARQKENYGRQLEEQNKTIEKYKAREDKKREAMIEALKEAESKPLRAGAKKVKPEPGKPAKAGRKKEKDIDEL